MRPLHIPKKLISSSANYSVFWLDDFCKYVVLTGDFAGVLTLGSARFIFPLFIRKFQCVKTSSLLEWACRSKHIFHLFTLNFPCGLPTIRYFLCSTIIIPLHPNKSLYKDSKTFCTPLLAESSSCEQYIRHNKHAYIP